MDILSKLKDNKLKSRIHELWSIDDFYKLFNTKYTKNLLKEWYDLLCKSTIIINIETRVVRIDNHEEVFDGDITNLRLVDFIIIVIENRLERSDKEFLIVQKNINEKRQQMKELLEEIKGFKDVAIERFIDFKVGDIVDVEIEKTSGGFSDRKTEIVTERLYISDIIYKEQNTSLSGGMDFIHFKFLKVKKDGNPSKHSFYMWESKAIQSRLNMKLVKRTSDE